MEFLVLFIERKGAPACAPAGECGIAQYARELREAGTLLHGAPLAAEAEGVRVAVRDGRTLVSDGPFAESKEAIGGFWILEAPSREEAVAIARRAFERGAPEGLGAVDVHRVAQRYSVGPDPGAGTPYLFAFHHDPFLADPERAKLEEMIAYGAALARDGKLFETSPLAREGAPARIESRAGRTLVTEGPFAESKEVIGGYSLLRAGSRDEALEIARRYPHAKWGTVEVREMVEPS